MLGNGIGGVSGNISPGNAAAVQISFVQIVGSGGSDTDKL